MLADIVLKDIPDASGESGKRFLLRLQQILGKVTIAIPSNPEIWDVCARLEKVHGSKETVLECRQKQMRALQIQGWESEKTQFEKVVKAAKLLVEAYVDEGSSNSFFSATLMLNGLLKKTEKYFIDTTPYQELRSELQRIKELEKIQKAN